MCTTTLRDGRTLCLREPTLDDAAQLVEYAKTIGGETDFLLCDENGIPGLTVEGELEYIQSTLEMPNTRMLLGFVDGYLAALADVRSMARPRVAHNATLSLTVKRAYWGLGIGTALMEELVAFSKGTSGLKNLRLDVRADNVRAIRLYERFGFQACGRFANAMCVNGQYFDLIDMQLEL